MNSLIYANKNGKPNKLNKLFSINSFKKEPTGSLVTTIKINSKSIRTNSVSLTNQIKNLNRTKSSQKNPKNQSLVKEGALPNRNQYNQSKSPPLLAQYIFKPYDKEKEKRRLKKKYDFLSNFKYLCNLSSRRSKLNSLKPNRNAKLSASKADKKMHKKKAYKFNFNFKKLDSSTNQSLISIRSIVNNKSQSAKKDKNFFSKQSNSDKLRESKMSNSIHNTNFNDSFFKNDKYKGKFRSLDSISYQKRYHNIPRFDHKNKINFSNEKIFITRENWPNLKCTLLVQV